MPAKQSGDDIKRKRGRPPKANAAASAPLRTRGRPGPDQDTVGPESLIEMTLSLLSTHAPSEITRASLARHANVDPGLIRYYFNDRDSLMRTAAEMLTDRLQRRGAAASERPDLTPSERISERMLALLDFKSQNPFYHRLMMEEMAKSDDDASRKLFNQIADGAIKRYGGYVEAGGADGTLRAVDPAFLYMAIIGLCDFFVIASPMLKDHFAYQSPDELREAYGAFICDLLLNGLRQG
jgi:AcrR family transcriptional regulator